MRYFLFVMTCFMYLSCLACSAPTEDLKNTENEGSNKVIIDIQKNQFSLTYGDEEIKDNKAFAAAVSAPFSWLQCLQHRTSLLGPSSA